MHHVVPLMKQPGKENHLPGNADPLGAGGQMGQDFFGISARLSPGGWETRWESDRKKKIPYPGGQAMVPDAG